MTSDFTPGPNVDGWLLVGRRPNQNDVVSAKGIFHAAWRGRYWVIGMAALFTAVSLVYVLLSHKTYEAVAVVTLADDADLSKSTKSGLGGLASLAGLSLDAGGRKSEYIALLSSRIVIGRFIEKNGLLPTLLADRWDQTSKQWILTHSHKEPPTLTEGVRKFQEKILDIDENRTTGLVAVKVRWTSPVAAARWANGLIEQVNDQTRKEALEEAKNGLDFLTRELANTTSIQTRESIYKLTENNLNKIMLANVKPEYALKIIDPAVADPEKISSPTPLLVIFLGLLCGAFIGALVAIYRYLPTSSASSLSSPDVSTK